MKSGSIIILMALLLIYQSGQKAFGADSKSSKIQEVVQDVLNQHREKQLLDQLVKNLKNEDIQLFSSQRLDENDLKNWILKHKGQGDGFPWSIVQIGNDRYYLENHRTYLKLKPEHNAGYSAQTALLFFNTEPTPNYRDPGFVDQNLINTYAWNVKMDGDFIYRMIRPFEGSFPKDRMITNIRFVHKLDSNQDEVSIEVSDTEKLDPNCDPRAQDCFKRTWFSLEEFSKLGTR